MNGWMLQWYLKVPALLRATVAEEFGSMFPVSKLLPSSAVNVCAVVSLLVTVTFVPRLTVIAGGTNLKFAMLTELEPLGLDCDDPPDDEEPPDCAAFGLEFELELPQPAIGPATAAAAASGTMT